MSEFLYLLFLIVGLPAFLSRVVMRGNWPTIARAFAIWAAILLSAFFLMTSSIEQSLGWACIFALFWSFTAVPLIVVCFKVLRAVGVVSLPAD